LWTKRRNSTLDHDHCALSRRLALSAALATLALGLTGCDRGTRPPEPVKGASLNASFPASGEGFTVVFTQEKAGFVQATLKQSGADVASLAIADLIDNAEAKAMFAGSTERIAGHPYAPNGSKGHTPRGGSISGAGPLPCRHLRRGRSPTPVRSTPVATSAPPASQGSAPPGSSAPAL